MSLDAGEFRQISVLYENTIRAVTDPQDYFSSDEYCSLKRLANLVFERVKSKCATFVGIARGSNKGQDIGVPVGFADCFADGTDCFVDCFADGTDCFTDGFGGFSMYFCLCPLSTTVAVSHLVCGQAPLSPIDEGPFPYREDFSQPWCRSP